MLMTHRRDTSTVSILIAALGGEGGGVLCEWLVDAATRAGHPVQGTSIPGVAQRTGATTYFVEIGRQGGLAYDRRPPVLGLYPVAGRVDLLVASELMEAARAALNGYVDAEHTTSIYSTCRFLTTAEKMPMGDGRFDVEALQTVMQQCSKRAISFDMQTAANEAKTIVSAVMFGAIAASGQLPFSRIYCETAIGVTGKGTKASLAGFELGFRAVESGQLRQSVAPTAMRRGTRDELVIARLAEKFPAETHEILNEGSARLVAYQDSRYAMLYLDRLERILNAERQSDPRGTQSFALTCETGRFLALWMAFDDVIKVAQSKVDPQRFERIRDEISAKPGEPVRVTEYFKPRLAEVAGLLPPGLSRLLLNWARRRTAAGHNVAALPLKIRSDSIWGFTMLRTISALRRFRSAGARFQQEQVSIECWLDAIVEAGQVNWQAALEFALCGRLIKGYGETNERGQDNLSRILMTFQPARATVQFPDLGDYALAIRSAREAALADPDGRTLDRHIAPFGVAARPPVAKPIRFVKRRQNT